MSDNKSLNRGLDALLGDQKLATTTKEIDLEKITAGRYQPRQEFDEVKIQELADSIKKHGVLSPILVRSFARAYAQLVPTPGGGEYPLRS